MNEGIQLLSLVEDNARFKKIGLSPSVYDRGGENLVSLGSIVAGIRISARSHHRLHKQIAPIKKIEYFLALSNVVLIASINLVILAVGVLA